MSAVFVGATADGFVTGELSGVLPEGTDAAPAVLTLVAAARLTGKCEFVEGTPESFSITFWNAGRGIYDERSFPNDSDGTFAIDDVPVGPLNVIGTHQLGRSNVASLNVSATESNHTVLSFGHTIDVNGKVVDAVNNEPVIASIQATAMALGSPLFPYGSPARTLDNGDFSVAGMSSGETMLSAVSPGYAPTNIVVRVDFSTINEDVLIRMPPLVDFSIDLEGHDKLGQCFLSLSGPVATDQVALSRSGAVTFPDLPPGPYTVYLSEMDSFGFALRTWVDSQNTNETIRIPSAASLDVIVRGEGGGTPPPHCFVELFQAESSPPGLIRTKQLLPNGRLTLTNVASGPAVLSLLTADYQALAVQEIQIDEGDSNLVKFDLPISDATLRVVETTGRPLPGALVDIAEQRSLGGWSAGHQADSTGTVVLRGMGLTDLVVALAHGDRYDYQNRVQVDSMNEIELVFEADSALAVQLNDREVPLSGIPITARVPGTPFSLPMMTTEHDGNASWPAIAEGRYQIDSTDLSLWDVSTDVEVRGARTEVRLDVRREGALGLTIRTAEGLPLVDTPIRLSSHEFGEDVASWIESGRVVGPANGLRTDSEGRLKVSGIPNGVYTLQLNGPEGPVSRELTIPAWNSLEYEVQTP